ncbi:hypothetical protein [Rhodoplanes sp. SY1]
MSAAKIAWSFGTIDRVVIPGRAEGANPESSGKRGALGWILGSALRAAPE